MQPPTLHHILKHSWYVRTNEPLSDRILTHPDTRILARLLVVKYMNKELHTLLWYIRADLVLLRKKSSPLSPKLTCFDKYAPSTLEKMVNPEIYDILFGIIATLEDMFESETMLWNSILLENLIQAFTGHVRNLDMCHAAAEGLKSTSVSLENNYIRVKCHLDTILSILRFNIISMCSSVSLKKTRESLAIVPLYQRFSHGARPTADPVQDFGLKRLRSGHSVPSKSSFVSRQLRHTNSLDSINNTSNIPPPLTLKRSKSEKTSSENATNFESFSPHDAFVKTRIYQHSRRRLKMCSKLLIDEHDKSTHAILNSVGGDGPGVSVTYSSSSHPSALTRASSPVLYAY